MRKARQNDRKEKVERSKLKFPTTESTQKLFRQFEFGYYEKKEFFVDENIQGQKCVEHGNEWSDNDPVEKGWWFSNNVKISHTSLPGMDSYLRKGINFMTPQ